MKEWNGIDGRSKCILYDNDWITPGQFENKVGSKAKKWKLSLQANDGPIGRILDALTNKTEEERNKENEDVNEKEVHIHNKNETLQKAVNSISEEVYHENIHKYIQEEISKEDYTNILDKTRNNEYQRKETIGRREKKKQRDMPKIGKGRCGDWLTCNLRDLHVS